MFYKKTKQNREGIFLKNPLGTYGTKNSKREKRAELMSMMMIIKKKKNCGLTKWRLSEASSSYTTYTHTTRAQKPAGKQCQQLNNKKKEAV